MMPSKLTYVVDKIVPMHEQALLDHLSNHTKQPMSIDRRVTNATSGPVDTMVRWSEPSP